MRSVIRIAATVDLPAVQAIVEAAYAPYIPRIGRKPGPMLDDYAPRIAERRVWVLEQDGQVVGILVLIEEPEGLLLDNVAVNPAAHGRGYGRMLLEFAEQSAAEGGYNSIRLYTNAAMGENIAMYQKIGYVETHRATVNGLHRVYMSKDLMRIA
jgi:ribosomal protein S18 acetylase RimI-like enzyme